MAEIAIVSASIAGASLTASTVSAVTDSLTQPETARSVTCEFFDYHLDIDFDEPTVYIDAGHSRLPPPTYIAPGHSNRFIFQKAHGTATGTYGVVTYKMRKVTQGESGRIIEHEWDGTTLVLMWGVPYDWNWYDSWHAVGIESSSTTANYDLYNKMYNNCACNFKRAKSNELIVHEGSAYGIPIKIMSTMSNANNATWNVSIK